MRNRIHIFLFLLIIFPSFLFSQTRRFRDDATSVKITVNSGGNVQFVFTSMNQYFHGLFYNNWTTLKIEFHDSIIGTPNIADPSSRYILQCKANDDNDNKFHGDSGDTLTYNAVKIWATGAGISADTIKLSKNYQTIISNGPQGISYINVTYKCGVLPGIIMLGRPPDYYSDNIVFTVMKQ